MLCYRFRTGALVGAWRSTAAEAADDAVRAGQAHPDSAAEDGLRWLVPGRIEEQHRRAA